MHVYLAVAGPIDYGQWSRALPHPSLPSFISAWQFTWPELASLHYNLVQGQASNWGVMPAHYYITNSLPKLLMTALPLVFVGITLGASERIGLVIQDNKGLGRAVAELGGMFGAGVVVLIGAMSAVGHKVSCLPPIL
jgi:alpha-1,6-mannosyltransferase